LVAVLAASMLIGGAQVAQSGEFDRQAKPDFDCDGVPDSAMSDAFGVVNGIEAGTVTVRYGADGRQQLISQASAGVPGSPEAEDRFGTSYTWYDRDLDGCDDLVVGAPGESVGTLTWAGSVTVVPGAPAGLATRPSVMYTQDSPGFPGEAENGDDFGWSLAAGRTSQGAPYLLIGSPNEDGPDSRTASYGSVYYLRGSTVSVIHQDSPGVAGAREADDLFGESLVAGDRFFAVAATGEAIGSVERGGMVHVFSNTLTSGRPTPIGAFHQNTAGITGTAERLDDFGTSLSVLSYRPASGDPIGALVAVGTPFEDVGSERVAGMAHLVYVSPGGALREQLAITQNTPGVTSTAEAEDIFGIELVLANLDPVSAVATPATLAWAVVVNEAPDDGSFGGGGVHVFRPGWRPGDPDIWLGDLLGENTVVVQHFRSSDTRLFLGAAPSCLSIGWQDILDGAPVQSEWTDIDDCGG
jgi:FG-GAP repeat protein